MNDPIRHEMLACQTLGPLHISIDGRDPPPDLKWRKNVALLLYLARSPQRARTRSHLVGLLWAEKTENAARQSLREAVRVIRKALGPHSIETEGEQVRLRSDAVRLDVDTLEEARRERRWADGAALVRGEFLEGFAVPGASAFESWLAAERVLWRRHAAETLLQAADALLENGDVSGATDLAILAGSLAPASDAVARLTIRCHALSSDRSAALEAYEGLRRALEDLGMEVEQETIDLAQRVREGRTWRVPSTLLPDERETRRVPLVGRESELSTLSQMWMQCFGTLHARVAIVEGDPGTGKTRLTEEITARARLDGAVVSCIRAVPEDAEEPGSAAIGLLEGGLAAASSLAAADPKSISALAAASPAVADRFRNIRPAADAAPLSRAFRDALRAIVEEQPVFLCLDDAQWVDHETLQSLHSAIRDLQDAPICIVMSIASPDQRSEVDEIRSRIGREISGATIALQPLNHDQLATLAAWAKPDYDDDQLQRLARRLEADSGGLPLLAVEVLHAVASGLQLAEHTPWPARLRTLDHTMPADLPGAIGAAIRVGFSRLSPGAQELLKVASAIGSRVPAEVFRRVTDMADDDLSSALDELEWHRWLIAEPRGYAFVARIIRDVVLQEMLTSGQRKRIEAAAGRPDG